MRTRWLTRFRRVVVSSPGVVRIGVAIFQNIIKAEVYIVFATSYLLKSRRMYATASGRLYVNSRFDPGLDRWIHVRGNVLRRARIATSSSCSDNTSWCISYFPRLNTIGCSTDLLRARTPRRSYSTCKTMQDTKQCVQDLQSKKHELSVECGDRALCLKWDAQFVWQDRHNIVHQ